MLKEYKKDMIKKANMLYDMDSVVNPLTRPIADALTPHNFVHPDALLDRYFSKLMNTTENHPEDIFKLMSGKLPGPHSPKLQKALSIFGMTPKDVTEILNNQLHKEDRDLLKSIGGVSAIRAPFLHPVTTATVGTAGYTTRKLLKKLFKKH